MIMKNVVLSLVLFTASVAGAETPADLSGHWKGTIEIPNNPVDFEMDVARNDRGELAGTVTAGNDRVTLPLLKIAIDGKQLTFYARTDQPFRGEIADSGKMISGTATLSGYMLPFSMGRTGDAKIEPPPTSPAVSKELEGVWKGVMSAGSAQYHLVVTIVNQPGGLAIANSVSVDEGGLMLYLTVSQSGPAVKFESRNVPISYAGALNAGGTELVGTFTQGATSVPLTLTR
jgi:hypothetical protein